MELKIMKAKKDCSHGGWKEGELLLVDTDYDWDAEKVAVLYVLKRGGGTGLAEYKERLSEVGDEAVCEYLDTVQVPDGAGE